MLHLELESRCIDTQSLLILIGIGAAILLIALVACGYAVEKRKYVACVGLAACGFLVGLLFGEYFVEMHKRLFVENYIYIVEGGWSFWG